MGNFFQVILRQEQGLQDVVNVLWYEMTGSSGDPTTAQQVELADLVDSNLVTDMIGVQDDSLRHQSIEVISFTANWVRRPFLSHTKIIDRPGVRAGDGAPPLVACIYSFRLEPTIGLVGWPPGPRRGYLALAGVVEGDMDPNGFFNTAFINSVAATAFRAELATSYVSAITLLEYDPIRVSRPNLAGQRGVSVIVQALTRGPVSSRRSRKVGVGS